MSIASRKEMNVRKYAEFGRWSGKKNSQAKYKEDLILSLKLLLKGLPIPPKYFAKTQIIPERATYYLHWEKRKQLNKQLGGVCGGKRNTESWYIDQLLSYYG
jgi:hypothetical protein